MTLLWLQIKKTTLCYWEANAFHESYRRSNFAYNVSCFANLVQKVLPSFHTFKVEAAIMNYRLRFTVTSIRENVTLMAFRGLPILRHLFCFENSVNCLFCCKLTTINVDSSDTEALFGVLTISDLKSKWSTYCFIEVKIV